MAVKEMKILLAVDGSEFSLAAVEEAARLPWPQGSIVKIVSVAEVPVLTAPGTMPIVGGSYQAWERVLEERSVENVTHARARFGEIAGSRTEVTSRILKGEPKVAILDFAADWHPDLMMFGTHGYTAIERLWLGSVSRALISHAKCSVEIVRRRRASDSGRQTMKLLLAVDGSEFSDAAVEEVANRAWPRECEVHIVSVIDLPVVASTEVSYVPESYYFHMEDSGRKQAESAVSRALSRLRESNAAREVPLRLSSDVVEGKAEGTIIEIARNQNTDLIMVGSHGYRGLTRFLLGSVSQAIASHAPCSVQIVRIQKTEPGNGKRNER
jgi:nucleotide-binding universal stress UspA family protein